MYKGNRKTYSQPHIGHRDVQSTLLPGLEIEIKIFHFNFHFAYRY